jgi:hypothetical protein
METPPEIDVRADIPEYHREINARLGRRAGLRQLSSFGATAEDELRHDGQEEDAEEGGLWASRSA